MKNLENACHRVGGRHGANRQGPSIASPTLKLASFFVFISVLRYWQQSDLKGGNRSHPAVAPVDLVVRSSARAEAVWYATGNHATPPR